MAHLEPCRSEQANHQRMGCWKAREALPVAVVDNVDNQAAFFTRLSDQHPFVACALADSIFFARAFLLSRTRPAHRASAATFEIGFLFQ